MRVPALCLGLLLSLFAGSPGSALAALSTPPAPPQDAAQSAPASGGIGGRARGAWNLPSPAGPGGVHGVLRGPSGAALFEIEALLVLTPPASSETGGAAPPAKKGVLHGVLRALHGPSAGEPVALVHGEWAAGPGGKGVFHAAFVQPGADGGEPHAIGGVKGVFGDDHPGPIPGGFSGLWCVKLPG